MKKNLLFAFIAFVFIASCTKISNTEIGNGLIPPIDGITTKDDFKSLDLGQHLHFFDRVEYLKELSDLTPLRLELGLRTVFNTVEKLLNPALSDYSVTTAFHKPYVQKYLDIFSDYYKDVYVVKASEGSPEVFKDGKYLLYTAFPKSCNLGMLKITLNNYIPQLEQYLV